jgi:hypothetical protein
LGYPPVLFYKNIKIKDLRRIVMQGCDSMGVTGYLGGGVVLRRLFEGGGGGASIHAGGTIAHKWLLVKYLCEVVRVSEVLDFARW